MASPVRGLLAALVCAAGTPNWAVGMPAREAEYTIVQGDIQMPKGRDGTVLSNAGINDPRYLWPEGKVPYFIETSDTNPTNPASYALEADEAMVVQAIVHWEAKTCVRFTNCGSKAACPTNHIMFISDSNQCNSPVGRLFWSSNQINLARGCRVGGAIHEIAHSIGLGHEQARNDRDDFVYVDFSQIQAGMEGNFDKTGASGRSIGAYDYGSIMHYSATGFQNESKPTIVAPVAIGQHEGLSAGDVEGIHFMYNDCKAAFTKPRCITSQDAGRTHLIPHSKGWGVEFNAVYSSALTVTYTGTDAPSSMRVATVADGATTSDTATSRVTFTPAPSEAGKTFTISTTFSSEGVSATCSVKVEVAASSIVCFGLASTDPNVCGGRGKCVDNPLQPCQCNAGYSGQECQGLATCPTNYFDTFDASLGMWSPRGVGVRQQSSLVAVGAGAFLIGVAPGGSYGQASLSLLEDSQPKTISFYMAPEGAGTPTLSFRQGGQTCFQPSVQSGRWIAARRFTSAAATANTYSFFELTIDWITQKLDVSINGNKEVMGGSFSGSCTGLDQVVYFGSGYMDEFKLTCFEGATAPVTPPTVARTTAPVTPSPPTPAPHTPSPPTPTPAPVTPVPRTCEAPDTFTSVCGADASLRCVLRIHTGSVLSVAHSPNGTEIVAGGADGVVRVFNAATGAQLRSLACGGFAAHDVSFSPDGARVAVGGAGGRAVVCDATTGAVLLELEQGNVAAAPVRRVRFSPDGRLLVAGGVEEEVTRVHDAVAGLPKLVLPRHSRDVEFVPAGAGSGSGSGVAAARVAAVAVHAEAGEAVRVFSVHDGQQEAAVVSVGARVKALSFSPNGDELARGMDDGTVRVGQWAGNAASERLRLQHSSGLVFDVQHSPDGRLVAAAGVGPVLLWGTSSGAAVAALAGHVGAVRRLSFSPSGTRVATAGHDGQLIVWDVSGL